MKIKKIIARAIKDSRGEKTISIIVKTAKGKFTTSAPAGKSKGKYEVNKVRVIDELSDHKAIIGEISIKH